jgi:hypothetical protein
VISRHVDEGFCGVATTRDEGRFDASLLQQRLAALKQRALLIRRRGVEKTLRHEALRDAGRTCRHDDHPATRAYERRSALERALGRRRAVVSHDNGSEGRSRHGQPRNGRSTSHVHVAGGSLAGNDHSLISSTVGRVEAGCSWVAWSIALAGGGGSPGCASRMLFSLIPARRFHNGVGSPRISRSMAGSHPAVRCSAYGVERRARRCGSRSPPGGLRTMRVISRPMVSRLTRCSWWPSSISPAGSTSLDRDAE